MANKIILRSGVHIGEPAAEDDMFFLKECFVALPIIDQLTDIDSSKCVLLGRTGSGKTAILQHIESTHGNVTRINPSEVSFKYISNSNLINFLVDLDFDLNVLFQLLWKHVIFTKTVKIYFESKTVFEKALDRLLDKKNPARSYFEAYGDSFWIEQDEIIREVSEGFESRLASELKVALGEDFAKVEAGLAASVAVSGALKKEILARAKKAVSDLQIQELGRAIDSLNDLMENKQKKYYILIDDIDLDWVENKIKYPMIRSLVESVKNFRKVRCTKVILALRSDVYERALLSMNSESFQPEKYEGIVLEIRWNQADLRKIIDRRIDYLFKKKYTKQGVRMYDLFPKSIRKNDTFDFIVERTLMRPRDLIAFVNLILDRAAGATVITPRHITDSEPEYSKKRYQALCYEWKSMHPNLGIYLSFLKGRTGKIEISDIAARDIVVDICLHVDEAQKEGAHKDGVVRQCEIYAKRENEARLLSVAATLLSILYKVGAISLKLNKGDPYKFCFHDESYILPEQISLETAFTVVPMLWRTLGITPNIG